MVRHYDLYVPCFFRSSPPGAWCVHYGCATVSLERPEVALYSAWAQIERLLQFAGFKRIFLSLFIGVGGWVSCDEYDLPFHDPLFSFSANLSWGVGV